MLLDKSIDSQFALKNNIWSHMKTICNQHSLNPLKKKGKVKSMSQPINCWHDAVNTPTFNFTGFPEPCSWMIIGWMKGWMENICGYNKTRVITVEFTGLDFSITFWSNTSRVTLLIWLILNEAVWQQCPGRTPLHWWPWGKQSPHDIPTGVVPFLTYTTRTHDRRFSSGFHETSCSCWLRWVTLTYFHQRVKDHTLIWH